MVAKLQNANGGLSAHQLGMIEPDSGQQDVVIPGYDISTTDKGVKQVSNPQLKYKTRNSSCFAEIQLFISIDGKERIFIEFNNGSIYRYTGDMMKERFSNIVAADLLKPTIVRINEMLPIKQEVPSAGTLYNQLLKFDPEVTSLKWFEPANAKDTEKFNLIE
jgi:hypothetical protein